MDIAQSLFHRAAEIADALPPWLIGVLVLAITAIVTVVLHGIVFRLVQRLIQPRLGEFGQKLLHRIERPSRIGALILTLSGALQVVPIHGRPAELLGWILLLAFIAFVGWCAIVAVDTAADLYALRAAAASQDPFLSRRHATQIRLLRRTTVFLIYFITFSALLMTIPAVRQFGVSLFASAGVAGLVIGLAARPMLSNLIAGVQIAVTQPVRLGDEVIMENEFGTIEEIRSTYFVLKTWDWRRLILPLSYVMEKPFQNWTLSSSSQIGAIFWYVDLATPIEPIRRKYEELVKASKLWDGQVLVLQVTDVTRDAQQIRGLASAASAGAAFDLRCEIREKLLTWINEQYPQSLPLVRQLNFSEADEQRPTTPPAPRAQQGRDGPLSPS